MLNSFIQNNKKLIVIECDSAELFRLIRLFILTILRLFKLLTFSQQLSFNNFKVEQWGKC